MPVRGEGWEAKLVKEVKRYNLQLLNKPQGYNIQDKQYDDEYYKNFVQAQMVTTFIQLLNVCPCQITT